MIFLGALRFWVSEHGRAKAVAQTGCLVLLVRRFCEGRYDTQTLEAVNGIYVYKRIVIATQQCFAPKRVERALCSRMFRGDKAGRFRSPCHVGG
jgi:hypothetical protein